MKYEAHLAAFEERKETIYRWAIEVRGIEKSQRIIGDNASKAIVELFSAFLRKKTTIEEGFQLNHAWFKSEKIFERLPEFEGKESMQNIIEKMILLEKLCEKLSYGTQKPNEKAQEAFDLFRDLEASIKKLIT